MAQKQYEPALLELDRAIGLDGQVDFQDFVFFMRKVQIQLLRDRGDLAETELDQIFKILPEDPRRKKYVATRLASLASDLFAMKRSADANRLLVRCKQARSVAQVDGVHVPRAHQAAHRGAAGGVARLARQARHRVGGRASSSTTPGPGRCCS